MATGDPGHHGTPALSLVEVVSRLVSDCAMTLHQNTAAKSVLVMPKTLRYVTRKTAQLVRHFNNLQLNLMYLYCLKYIYCL